MQACTTPLRARRRHVQACTAPFRARRRHMQTCTTHKAHNLRPDDVGAIPERGRANRDVRGGNDVVVYGAVGLQMLHRLLELIDAWQ